MFFDLCMLSRDHSAKPADFRPEDEEQKKFVQEAMITQDVFIQGGTWLFDERGNTLWNHIDTAPEDHAAIDQILSEINRHH